VQGVAFFAVGGGVMHGSHLEEPAHCEMLGVFIPWHWSGDCVSKVCGMESGGVVHLVVVPRAQYTVPEEPSEEVQCQEGGLLIDLGRELKFPQWFDFTVNGNELQCKNELQ
jgi:hypothetical protein